MGSEFLKRQLGYYSLHLILSGYLLLDGSDVVTALIITLGCIVITGMVIGYLVWRYGSDQRYATIEELVKNQEKTIQDLKDRIDSLHTKIGARKL